MLLKSKAIVSYSCEVFNSVPMSLIMDVNWEKDFVLELMVTRSFDVVLHLVASCHFLALFLLLSSSSFFPLPLEVLLLRMVLLLPKINGKKENIDG